MVERPPSDGFVEASASVEGWRERFAFQSILALTADKAGEEFLRQMVREVARALDVSHAFVAEFAGSPERVRTIGFWGDGAWLPNVEFDLEGTPCSEVIRTGVGVCRDGVQQAYPRDSALRELGVRSYLGVLLSSEVGPVGHLAVLDRKPIRGHPSGLAILRLFAERARVELDRVRAEHALHETLSKLRSELEEQSIAIATSSRELGLAYEELAALLRMNQAVGRGLERDDLFGALAANLSSLLPTDRFGIEMPHGESELRGHLLTPVDGKLPSRTDAHVLPAAGTACDWVLRKGECVITSSREELHQWGFEVTFEVMEREGMESLCVVPLKSGSECRAALFFMAAARGAYDDVRRGLLDELGSAVAVALDNSLAHEEVRALRDRLAAENQYLREEITRDHDFTEIVGRSQALRQKLREVEQVAPTDATVLILGESGTGKELVARALHALSARSGHPLIKVNCAAIPDGLVESELFGHEKGAFTGAGERRVGRFELADGGTIFLDEIGELPLDAQVKLLRVLQEREFERVGGSRTCRVDVRVLAATNRDLKDAIAEGRFREDLFYRLNVFPLVLPPLRERAEDIALLARFFVDRASPRIGRRVRSLEPAAVERLTVYAWPGNVRELENAIERALILCSPDDTTLRAALIAAVLPWPGPPAAPAGRSPETVASAPRPERHTLESMKRQHVEETLRACGGRVEGARGAAAALGLAPSTLRSLMKRLGIQRAPAPLRR